MEGERVDLWASLPLTLGIGYRARPPHRHAAPRLAVFGCPSAPWPDVPASRILKVLVLAPCRAPGSCSPPGCPPLQNISGVRRPPPGSGRRAPPWVVGGSPADALCGKRLRLPALPARHVGIGFSGAVLGGGPADEHSGLSVVGFQLCRVGIFCFSCGSEHIYCRLRVSLSIWFCIP